MKLDLQTTNGTDATRPVTEIPALRPCDVCDTTHRPTESCMLYVITDVLRVKRRNFWLGFGYGLASASLVFLLAWHLGPWGGR